jgi:hypothetical protein
LGILFMPLHFWKHIGFARFNIGYNNHRIVLGFGIFEIFWDVKGNFDESREIRWIGS